MRRNVYLARRWVNAKRREISWRKASLIGFVHALPLLLALIYILFH